ncbi:response regulator [bacterium]|nr:response regulator [bacterium]
MNVLIVDDSTTMRKILINALKSVGITDIDEACDGQQAVDATLAKQYSVVLMDWNMPNMLGIDALKRIRLAGNQVPVIMVTTEAEKGRVIEALKAGANNYVIKPFKPEAIIAKIQEVTGAAK